MKIQPGFLLLHFFWSLKNMNSSFESPTSYQTLNCFRALVISSLMDWILDSKDDRLANSLNENTLFYCTNFIHVFITKSQSSTKDSNSIVQHCCQSYTTRCNPLLLYLANKSAKPLLWPPTKSASTFLKIIQHCHAMPLDSSFLQPSSNSRKLEVSQI